MVAASIGDLRLVIARCAHPRIEPAARNRRIEISADVFEPGALRHRLGSSRRGDGMLRLRAAIFVVAKAISRSAHSLASTGAGKTCLDDQRNYESAVARAASGTPERCRQSAAPAHFNGKEKQRLDGPRVRPHVARHSGSKWGGGRLSHHAASDEPRKREDL